MNTSTSTLTTLATTQITSGTTVVEIPRRGPVKLQSRTQFLEYRKRVNCSKLKSNRSFGKLEGNCGFNVPFEKEVWRSSFVLQPKHPACTTKSMPVDIPEEIESSSRTLSFGNGSVKSVLKPASSSSSQTTVKLSKTKQTIFPAVFTKPLVPQSLVQKTICNASNHQASFERTRTKALQTTGTTLACVTCWFPFFTLFVLFFVFYVPVPNVLFRATLWFGYINCIFTPLFYIAGKRELRL